MSRSVVVVGRGIAGSLGARLLERNNKVLVLERQASTRDASTRPVGVVLSMRCARLLETVVGARPPGQLLLGRLIHRRNGQEDFLPFGVSQLGVRRDDVVEFLGSDIASPVEYGVANIRWSEESKTVRWKSAGGQECEASADLCVVADGRNSGLRGVIGGQVRETPVGHCWRACEFERLWFKGNLRADCINIFPLERGFLHVIGTGQNGFTATLVLESEAMRELFAFGGDVPLQQLDTSSLLQRLAACPTGELSTVHCERFHSGSGVLLGDAAHATVLFAGQGLNAALDDAWVLNGLLEESSSVEEAVSRFSEVRVGETEAMHELGLLAYHFLFHPFPLWRVQYQQRMARAFGKRPASLYSMINSENNVPYSEALQQIKHQNVWWKLGRIQ